MLCFLEPYVLHADIAASKAKESAPEMHTRLGSIPEGEL